MLCQLWYPSQRTGHQDLDSQIPWVLSGHLRWWWAGINKQLEAIKFLIMCKAGHHAWFPTPLWVILSLPMRALLPSTPIPTPCWARQLSAGCQSLTRGAPPRQKRLLDYHGSPLCVYWFTSKYLWDDYHSSGGWIWEIWIVCKCCWVNTAWDTPWSRKMMGTAVKMDERILMEN